MSATPQRTRFARASRSTRRTGWPVGGVVYQTEAAAQTAARLLFIGHLVDHNQLETFIEGEDWDEEEPADADELEECLELASSYMHSWEAFAADDAAGEQLADYEGEISVRVARLAVQ